MAFLYDMTDTWNAAPTTFTGLKLNVTDTASAAGSLLEDIQIGGVSQRKLTKTGQQLAVNGNAAAPSYSFSTSSNTGWYLNAAESVSLGIVGVPWLTLDGGGVNSGIRVQADNVLAWTAGFSTGSPDLILRRDAANTLAQRNGTAAQAFRVYNSYTDGANFERANIGWSANRLTLETAKAGTGLVRDLELAAGADIVFSEAGISERWKIKQTSGSFQPATSGTVGLGSNASLIKHLFIDYTNTATVGAVTINKAAGRVNIAAAGTSVVVTNSLVTAASKVFAVMASADSTGRVISVIPAAGSFTINTVAVAAQTAFDFFVVNTD